MEATDLKDQLEIEFVDLMEADIQSYDYARPTLEKGYPLPITFINEKAVSAGGLDSNRLYLEVKKFI
ncbi:hypothetical protein SAMN05660297_01907 [Natronincola peptidivorans]|uniref:Uncharacterized protein n=1 Tax=Natronincola peptidivorans TaxID=426128 RepID=A0A1I0D7W3_9FIRM|nr:hypothetical protein [Natronincola peptidivorans]SET28324.1 hypothetical protein SAMN05660297_01907 [Natronincola peptidivorans]